MINFPGEITLIDFWKDTGMIDVIVLVYRDVWVMGDNIGLHFSSEFGMMV